MELSHAEINKKYKITALYGGRMFQHRILALGLYVGEIIEIDRKAPFRGPFLIKIDTSIVAIGRNIAHKIDVEEI